MRCDPANTIIEKLGGLSAVARIVDVKPHTVMRWRMPRDAGGTGGAIPHWHWDTLIASEKGQEVKLTRGDFAGETSGAVTV
jgi:hypothetical protein